MYPNMVERMNDPRFMNPLMAHLDACKDVCDHFGITTVLLPYHDPNDNGRIGGLTVKSYRNPDSDPDSYEFEYDPFWDDGTDFEDLYEGLDDELVEEAEKNDLPPIKNRIPDDDDEIMDITKSWVKKVMSDMGICPFTSGADMAGLPIGKVFY